VNPVVYTDAMKTYVYGPPRAFAMIPHSETPDQPTQGKHGVHASDSDHVVAVLGFASDGLTRKR